jgi:hypothetical protein
VELSGGPVTPARRLAGRQRHPVSRPASWLSTTTIQCVSIYSPPFIPAVLPIRTRESVAAADEAKKKRAPHGTPPNSGRTEPMPAGFSVMPVCFFVRRGGFAGRTGT